MRKSNDVWLIASFYLIFGVLWIIITDALVDHYFEASIVYSTVKGLVFVLMSSIIIYLAVKAQSKSRRKLEMQLTEESKKGSLYRDTLSDQSKRFIRLVSKTPLPAMLHAENNRIIAISSAFTELTGYTINDIATINALAKKIPEEHQKASLDYFADLFNNPDQRNQKTMKLYNSDNKMLIFDLHSAIIGYDENGLKNMFSLAVNVTDYQNKASKLQYLTEHDDLTNTHNKRFFDRFTEEHKHKAFGFILADINSLKLINDIYGHQKGDELLKLFAKVIKQYTPKESKLCRLGGDEFAIITTIIEREQLNEIITNIQNTLLESRLFDVKVSASFGMAIKTSERTFTQVYAEAEHALYTHKTHLQSHQNSLVLKSIMKTMFEHSDETNEHLTNLLNLAQPLIEELEMLPEEKKDLELLIKIHDIGKINVTSDIFSMARNLEKADLEEVQKHPEYGYRIANALPQLKTVAYAILTHHENVDGSGYPFGLKGEEIPYIARILRILDSYETMTSGRLYKKKKTAQQAIQELNEYAGSYYDKTLVERFVRAVKKA